MAVYPRLFVTRLAGDVDESALFEFFSRWCSVRSAKIVREPDARSKNYAFVEVQSDDDVEQALQLDGYLFHDRRIVVTRARGRQ